MLEPYLAFLVVLGGTEAFFDWLAVVNLRYGERRLRERADWVRDRFGVEDPARLADYQRANTGLGLLGSVVQLAILLLLVFSGVFGAAVASLDGLGLPPLARGALLFAGVAVALFLVSWPFDAVDTFVVEELFGFNRQTVRLFLRDGAVSLGLSIVLAGLLGTALLWVVETFPRTWAVGGAVLYLVFALAMQVVYPRVVVPLFYDFERLDAGELREAVDDLFERAGFHCDQVYEMDASRRSRHSNAYFVGFGRTKRVVLFDTLVEQMSVPEIQSVLAHELAHWREAHVWKLTAAGVVQVAVLLGVAQLLLASGWLTGVFGVPAGATAAQLLLALWLVAPLGEWLAPLANRLSLGFERAADDFAVELTDVPSMVGALETLVGENLSNPFYHPLYETFHASHPPIPERISRLETRDGPTPAAVDEDGVPG